MSRTIINATNNETLAAPSASGLQRTALSSLLLAITLSMSLSLVLALGLTSRPAQAEEPSPLIVGVGAYHFPPFLDDNVGVTPDLIKAMNAFQKQYKFVMVPTSAGRRYKDMRDGKFSLMLFESIAWGWENEAVDASRVYLQGDGEVYVALAKPGRNQGFFHDLAKRTLIGVMGYHYGFADFNANQAELAKKFRITFADDSEAMLRMLIKERGEIAVVTKSYLQSYLLKHPELQGKLLISDRMDQAYNHTALVRKGNQPGVKEIEKILDGMEKSGQLKKLWAQYGIAN